jgi:hypothetical protein
MGTRTCDRCGETCFGCDDRDDPHYCPSCKAKCEAGPCEHVEKFLSDLRGLYTKERSFVTLDEPISAHCHVCSGVHKIPEDLLRSKRPTERTSKDPTLSIKRFVSDSIDVARPDRERGLSHHEKVDLSHPISVWELSADDGSGAWKETYTSTREKEAFVRGYRAASWMHGKAEPEIREEGRS